jgi:hypothetical protein
VAALIQHGESSPAEHADVFGGPNLHTHAVDLNMATRADDTVGALYSTAPRDGKMAAGAINQAALANEMADLGFGIEARHRDGFHFTVSSLSGSGRCLIAETN